MCILKHLYHTFSEKCQKLYFCALQVNFYSIKILFYQLACFPEQKLDMSSCQKVRHVGLCSLTSDARSLQQLSLAYGSPVSLLALFSFSDT